MLLKPGGIDVYYIDESHDSNIYVVTAVCIPMLRNIENNWTITWPAMFEAARAWRRTAKENTSIPVSKELHGVKLASGRGNYLKGKYNFSRAKASVAYRQLLKNVSFLPNASVMSVTTNRGKTLYGNERLEACMMALFQRMRTKANKERVNAMTFFDQGHDEYRKLYRMAQVYLPTGSMRGMETRNLPMNMFFKDANEKNSKHCFFTQVADIIAYSAFLKIKSERGELTEWQSAYNLGTLYDELPKPALNIKAQLSGKHDAIVRI